MVLIIIDMRAALSQLNFSIIVLRVFTREFYAIGTCYAIYGLLLIGVARLRRNWSNEAFFTHPGRGDFRTGGGFVILLACLSFCLYIVIIVLIFHLPP